MSLKLENPQEEVKKIINFLKLTFEKQKIKNVVIGVSGGIDSALSTTLLVKAIDPKNIFPLFLPFEGQDMTDAREICQFNHLPETNIEEENIWPVVDSLVGNLEIAKTDKIRIGNIMARVRMIVIYDTAKKRQALVCGTENKSEKYLGYFTRFGDEASDLEPIIHLYKTQVWQLAKFLNLPEKFIKKTPSGGLWPNQSDEEELGFTYELADKVMNLKFDQQKSDQEIITKLGQKEIVARILEKIQAMAFKQLVPYQL